MQLTQIESVFRSLKSELGIRPIFHRLERRVDAHILIAFLAYSLQVTLKHRLLIHASGLTPTAVLEKLASIQMIDVWVPTTDGRWLILPRYTRPEKAPACCSRNSAWTCPPNRLLALPLIHPPPKRLVKKPFCGEDLSIALTESKYLPASISLNCESQASSSFWRKRIQSDAESVQS